MLRIAAGLLWLSNFTDSRVASDVSSEGELGGGTATAIGGMLVFVKLNGGTYPGTDREALRRIRCWCCSSISPLLPTPVSSLCFSSSATFALGARWRGGGGEGRGGGRGQERGGDSGALVLSL